MRKNIDSFPDDLWAIIVVMLPLKTITTSKLVSKQWKSIVESSFFCKLFLSHHQNSHSSSWSLMNKHDPIVVLAHYRCKIWGLQRSLNSYINSFITTKFSNHQQIYSQPRVVSYTDVGLVLIRVFSLFRNVSYFVVNPVSQECVETDPPWFQPTRYFSPLGIASRTKENGVLLSFKIVLLFDAWQDKLSLLIYSSKTGLWNPETVHFPDPILSQDFHNSISSNGNLHWLARNNDNDEAVVSLDFYSAGTGSVLVTPFPDLGKAPKFRRACTTCQGFLMYMNVVSVTKNDGSVEDRFSVWRLKSGEWQLVSEIARENDFNYIPFAVNPVDGKSIYFASRYSKRLLSMNLLNGEFVYHNKFERSIDGRTSSSVEGEKIRTCISGSTFSSFILPQWLHRIPNKVRKVWTYVQECTCFFFYYY